MEVLKYGLDAKTEQELMLPIGAQILTVGFQGRHIRLWALVDSEKDKERRTIMLYGTGQEIERCDQTYIGTAISEGAMVVFHIFEKLS